MGSSEGALKIAAKRRGISLDAYNDLIASGMKWCTRCKTWQPRGEFPRDSSRTDGLACSCTACCGSTSKTKRRRRQMMGTCNCCTEPTAPGRKQCERHLSMAREGLRRRQVDAARNGRCTSCACKAAAFGSRCERCWWMRLGSVYLGRGARHVELKALLDAQGGRCAISGRQIMPGVNGSVDHIVPRSKGGKNEISNLRWVERDANYYRGNMSDDDLIQLCRDIVAHADSKHGDSQ